MISISRYLIILTCLFSMSINAQQIVRIKKGEPSPFDGYVIDKKQEQKFRLTNETLKISEQLNIKLKDLSVNQESQIKLLNTYNNGLERRLYSVQFTGNFKGIGGFVLGILATTLALKVAQEAL